MHAAIVAGGLGTRAAALTGDLIPKALLPVAGVPIIIRQMRVLRREGVTRLSVLAGHLGDHLRPALAPEAAALTAWDKAEGPLAVYHAAGIGTTSVREIVEIVVAAAGRGDTRIVYSGSDRGWPGDVPRFRYDISRLQALGWQPRRHSSEAVRYAVERILANGF